MWITHTPIPAVHPRFPTDEQLDLAGCPSPSHPYHRLRPAPVGACRPVQGTCYSMPSRPGNMLQCAVPSREHATVCRPVQGTHCNHSMPPRHPAPATQALPSGTARGLATRIPSDHMGNDRWTISPLTPHLSAPLPQLLYTHYNTTNRAHSLSPLPLTRRLRRRRRRSSHTPIGHVLCLHASQPCPPSQTRTQRLDCR
jgi:hypothetical protein